MKPFSLPPRSGERRPPPSAKESQQVRYEKVDARCANGVLTLRVPKPPEAQRAMQRIEVKEA